VSEYFTISNCVFNFNILALVVSVLLGGPKFTLGGSVPPCTPLGEKFLYPRRVLSDIVMSNGVFNFNFLALVFSEIFGGSQIYTRGPYAPWTPPIGEFFFTQSEYFTISNCVFNFNILALVVSEILGRFQIYVRGPCVPCTPPSGKIFAPEASTLPCLMAFSISTF